MSQKAAVESRADKNMRVAADHQQILSQPKPTFAALDKAITDAAESVDLNDALRAIANEALKNQLFLSPRLARWQFGISDKNVEGYSLRNSGTVNSRAITEFATVTVTEDRVILSCPDPEHPKFPFNYEIMAGLNAATLYKSIQDAQAIIQPRTGVSLETADDFFDSGEDETFYEGAGLDSALEETHADPLVEEDAELIEEVTTPDPEDESTAAFIQRELASITTQADALRGEIAGVDMGRLVAGMSSDVGGFTSLANRKNATTDGIECEYCGRLNPQAYKGTCPQCPNKAAYKQPPKPWPAAAKSNSDSAARFKSLQGRVLTIIDGSFADKTQREAVKQMINKEFRREIGKVAE